MSQGRVRVKRLCLSFHSWREPKKEKEVQDMAVKCETGLGLESGICLNEHPVERVEKRTVLVSVQELPCLSGPPAWVTLQGGWTALATRTRA